MAIPQPHGHPYLYQGHPYGQLLGHPFLADGPPYLDQGHPYLDEGHPYLDKGHPYLATRTLATRLKTGGRVKLHRETVITNYAPRFFNGCIIRFASGGP